MNSKSIITPGDGTFLLVDLEVNKPHENEVLVEVKAAGVCHTDYDFLSGGQSLVMGHEGAGIVIETGAGVANVSPGDHVVMNWATPCGECFQCKLGNQFICENPPLVPIGRTTYEGVGIDRNFRLGTMSTHTVVSKTAVTKIDANIPFASAAIAGCGVMTGVGSVLNAANVKPGSSVVVLGTGGVGLNVIQGAKIARAGEIIAIDISPSRLEMALQFGATETILANRKDKGLLKAAEKVKLLTSNRGADYAFECTAIPALGAAPLAMVRNAGTAVQVSGIEEEITVDMNLFEWNKLYLNPLYGNCQPQRDFPRLFEYYHKGELLLDELVTSTYSLSELDKAFDDMHKGINAKGVLII